MRLQVGRDQVDGLGQPGVGASPPEEVNAPATPRDTGHIDEDLSAPFYDAEELDVDLLDFDGTGF